MARIVADTSSLVSLGTVSSHRSSPLAIVLEEHDLVVPDQVLEELRDTAAFDGPSGEAATAVLDRQSAFDVRSTELDETFPLDAGENAAVTLANEIGAAQLSCDEFNQLALIHASLAETRIVTTPTLLLGFVHNGRLSADTAAALLDTMSDARSWETNTYVERVRSTLEQLRE